MNEEDSFNPALPADFKLLNEPSVTDQGQTSAAKNPASKTQKTKRKSNRSERQAHSSSESGKKKKARVRWKDLKEKINAKLAGVDRNRLKQVLVACGIAGGVVLAVIVAVKLVPIAVLLLAVLGLACVIKIWDGCAAGLILFTEGND